jgi:cholesterol transport system auxiliary component
MNSPIAIGTPRRRFLAGSGALCLLSGCGTLFGGNAPRLYRLNPAVEFAADLPASRSQLVVATPQAIRSLDSDRIMLTRGPTGFDYFADAVWADQAPFMLQGLLVESFENSGKMPAVGRDGGDLTPDFILLTELRELQARYEAVDRAPVIVVRIGVKLIRMSDRRIVDALSAEAQGTATRNDIDGIVASFDDTLRPVLRQIVEWSLRRL